MVRLWMSVITFRDKRKTQVRQIVHILGLFPQFRHEFIDILEFPVNRSVPDKSHAVEFCEDRQ